MGRWEQSPAQQALLSGSPFFDQAQDRALTARRAPCANSLIPGREHARIALDCSLLAAYFHA